MAQRPKCAILTFKTLKRQLLETELVITIAIRKQHGVNRNLIHWGSSASSTPLTTSPCPDPYLQVNAGKGLQQGAERKSLSTLLH